ncbi:chorismate synthase [candidate division KSB1 bacterium]|nr:chorismate synthase [candidate division KSB1 bacterium]
MRFLTAGESHGIALNTIIEGVPAGLRLSESDIAGELGRRQRGYGRGDRMKIETDRARILSGVRYGKTIGSPISLLLENKDWINWQKKMSIIEVDQPADLLQMPRPGHADFAGMVKYRHNDLRNILERSSARETAMRVAAGAVAKKLLKAFGIEVFGHVLQIESISTCHSALSLLQQRHSLEKWRHYMERVENSSVACADASAEEKMIARIESARKTGDTLGGIFEVVAIGIPVGLGSHVHYDRKLDGLIALAMMSINAIKSVEIGLGKDAASLPGSEVHDEILPDKARTYYRPSNNAGGIEGGMSNGEPVVVRLAMKPIPTMSRPLRSIDAGTLHPEKAFRERADVCAVPAAVVVAEAMLALVLADSLLQKLGGDSVTEMKERFDELPQIPLERT